MFQSSQEDPRRLTQELHFMHQSLKGRLYEASGQKKTLDECEMGSKFLDECSRHIKKCAEGFEQEKEAIKLMQVKQRCCDMLEEALEQVNMRLPETANV